MWKCFLKDRAKAVTSTQQVINCDRGSVTGDRFKVSRKSNISAAKLLQAIILLGLISPSQWLQHFGEARTIFLPLCKG